MALSDYERRVLDEIESELSHAPRRRLGGVRDFCYTMRWSLLAAATLVGLVIGLIFVAPAVAVIAVALGGGLAAGFAVGSTWRRCHGWLRRR